MIISSESDVKSTDFESALCMTSKLNELNSSDLFISKICLYIIAFWWGENFILPKSNECCWGIISPSENSMILLTWVSLIAQNSDLSVTVIQKLLTRWKSILTMSLKKSQCLRQIETLDYVQREEKCSLSKVHLVRKVCILKAVSRRLVTRCI